MIRAIKGDITKVTGFDAIVNPANNSLLGGGGINGQIHRAAGPQLKTECRTLNGCETGDSKLTLGYNMHCTYIIHSVGPVWMGGGVGEPDLLKSCYSSTMQIAVDNNIRKIAFSSISTGEYGYPLDQAAKIGVTVINEFVQKYPDAFDDICWVLQDDLGFKTFSEEIRTNVPKKKPSKKAKSAQAEEESAEKGESVGAAEGASAEGSSGAVVGADESKVASVSTDSEAAGSAAQASDSGADSSNDSQSAEGETNADASASENSAKPSPSNMESITNNVSKHAEADNSVSAASPVGSSDTAAEVGASDTTKSENSEEAVKTESRGDSAEKVEAESSVETNSETESVVGAAENADTTSEAKTTAETPKSEGAAEPVNQAATPKSDNASESTGTDAAANTEPVKADATASTATTTAAPASSPITLKPLWDKYDIDWLISEVSNNNPHTYTCFWHATEESTNNILSQWYQGKLIAVNGRKYYTAEQYFMAEKALLFNDYDSYKLIMEEQEPSKCKKLGRNVAGFDDEIWKTAFREILFHGNVGKALSDEKFAEALLSTGDDVLIEASPFDDIYGAGMKESELISADGSLKVPPQEWHSYKSERQSENNLGFVLMAVRDYLKMLK